MDRDDSLDLGHTVINFNDAKQRVEENRAQKRARELERAENRRKLGLDSTGDALSMFGFSGDVKRTPLPRREPASGDRWSKPLCTIDEVLADVNVAERYHHQATSALGYLYSYAAVAKEHRRQFENPPMWRNYIPGALGSYQKRCERNENGMKDAFVRAEGDLRRMSRFYSQEGTGLLVTFPE
ncbi:MAG: hypothetical protein WAZ18_00135 [Alphaproteobacteria bacterium]